MTDPALLSKGERQKVEVALENISQDIVQIVTEWNDRYTTPERYKAMELIANLKMSQLTIGSGVDQDIVKQGLDMVFNVMQSLNQIDLP